MTGRAFAYASALLLGALVASGAASCTETTPAPLAGPTGPVSLSIVNPIDGAIIAIPDSDDASFPVTIDVMGSFYVRPPGNACLYTYNCGFLQLYIDGVLNNSSGVAIIDALIGRTPTRFGKHTLTVQLVWDLNDGGGQEMYDAGSAGPDAGVPGGLLTRSVTVTIVRAGDGGGTGDAGSGAGGGTGDAGPGDGGGAGDAGPGDGGGAGGATTGTGAGAGGAGPGDGGGTGGATAGTGAGAGGAAPGDGGAAPSDGGGVGDAGDGG